MPEMTRTWIIPASESHPELSFRIREPPLTGDNLGLKTWGTAFTIAKKLESFTDLLFPSLVPGCKPDCSSPKVLELGSGTGLVGIAAAAIWGVSVLLSDLPEIKENLEFNVEANREVVKARGGRTASRVLDWKNSDPEKYAEGTDNGAGGEFEVRFLYFIISTCVWRIRTRESYSFYFLSYLSSDTCIGNTRRRPLIRRRASPSRHQNHRHFPFCYPIISSFDSRSATRPKYPRNGHSTKTIDGKL
jgi:hypothetical protein